MNRVTSRALLLPLAALLLPACGQGQADAPEVVPAVPVRVAEVSLGALSRSYTLTGRLAPNESVEIRPKVAGRIVAFHRDEGDRVEAGEKLVTLDKEELRLELARSEAAVAQATARVKEAARALERSQGLFERDIASRAALDGAQAEADIARADARRARAERDLAAQRLSEADILAPIAGVLQERGYSVGDLVVPSASRGNGGGGGDDDGGNGFNGPLFTLIQVDPLRLEVHIAEQDVPSVGAIGADLPLTVDLFPDRSFTGKLAYVAPSLHPLAHTLMIRALLPNVDGALKPGMFARLHGAAELARNAVVVPIDAVVNRGGRASVYVLTDEDTVQLRAVDISASTADRAAVADGLVPGERVVIEGHSKLREGTPVRLVADRPAPARS